MMDEVEDVNKVTQKKCPSCGAFDISLDIETGKLKCNYCGTIFLDQKVENNLEVKNLYGENFSEGTADLSKEEEILTLKCDGCGAEIIINKLDLSQAKCHWCGSALSIEQKISNGSIPDMILPFKITKQEAKNEMDNFIGKKRKRYALPDFLNNLKEENIKGVYLPYMIVDINSHARFKGKGEITTKKYTVKRGNDSKETRYDADLYNVKREFDITMKGLTIEANSDKFNTLSQDKTNNIINAILPFDIDNCVKWDPNYLRGYALERRDLNVNNVNILVDAEAKDIARYKTNDTLKKYDRGVKWEEEDLSIKGTQWKMAYLPVWIYNYHEKRKDGTVLQNYLAVNGRTKETMGSIPMNSKKYLIDICFTGFILFLALLLFSFFVLHIYNMFLVLFLFSYFLIFFIRKYKRKVKLYRNTDVRHYHEIETKSDVFNMITEDSYIRKEKGLTSSTIEGLNNINIYARTIRIKNKRSIEKINNL